MCKTMDQEMMQLKHELKEFVEKGQHILQKMDGGMMDQRMYGMRGGQSGGYSGGQGGGYGQRDHWQGQYPQQGMPMQGYPPYPQQDMMQGMNPIYFL